MPKRNSEVCSTFFTCVWFYISSSVFCEFQCLFYKSTLVLIFIMGIFYFTLIWLKYNKIKSFFPPTFNKFAIQNNPVMQLRLVFHKTGNKNNIKEWKLKSHWLSSFSSIRKTETGVEVGVGKFVLFLWSFLSVHINFQYKLNSHKISLP